MTAAQQFRNVLTEMYRALSEDFASLWKSISEKLNKMIEHRKEAYKYIERKKDTRKGWFIVRNQIRKNQVEVRKPARVFARSCC